MTTDERALAMGRTPFKLPAPVRIALTAGLLLLVVFSPNGEGTRLMGALHNGAHAVVFACIALLLLSLLRDTHRLMSMSLRAQCWLAWAMTVVLGALTELLQIPTGRDASWMDLGNDALGAFAGLAVFAAFHATRLRVALLGLATIAMLIAEWPVLIAVAAQLSRDARFPVLVDFARHSESYYISAQSAEAVRARLPSQWRKENAETALHVVFGTGRWPGLVFDEPKPDWTGYSTLLLDLTNPTDTPLRLSLRVHDREHNQQYSDRFNRIFEIAARTRTELQIPLSEVRTAPRGREMDMHRIAGIVLFRVRDCTTPEFYVSKMELR